MKENKIIWDYDNGNFDYYQIKHTEEDFITVKVKDLIEILDVIDWELFDKFTFWDYEKFLKQDFSNYSIEFIRVITMYGNVTDFDTVKEAKDYINGLVANPKNQIYNHYFEIKIYLHNYDAEEFANR